MTSSNVLDLNAYKYQCSYPDLVKREIWRMRKLYVPNGSRKLNAVNRIHICVCVRAHVYVCNGGNTQSSDIRGIPREH